MDSAREVDLARGQAPASQVLSSALGQAAYHQHAPNTEPSSSGEPQAEHDPARPLLGASATTAQVKLKPKSSDNRSSHSNSSFEMQDFGESVNVSTLQPMDKGFGAWSYVASAFAMYIVVWAPPSRPPVSKLTALRTPTVLYTLLASLMFDLVMNVPRMFITSYAASIGLKPSDQALALSLLALSDMLGTYVLGALSDNISYQMLLTVCALSTSLAHFLLWGYAKAKLGVFVYAVVVGLTSGGSDNCLFSFYSEVSGGDGELFTAIHSLFSGFGGIAILSVGPVGTALLKLSPNVEVDLYAIGRFKFLILYAGNIYDDKLAVSNASSSITDDELIEPLTWRSPRATPAELKERLNARDPRRTRWINVVGLSRPLLAMISQQHLGNHRCLDIDTVSKQILGGPVDLGRQGKFIWLQTEVWFVGKRVPLWSSMRRATLRIVVCLPTATHAGTLITNFVGRARLAQELNDICVRRILQDHSLGCQALGCVWILAFSLLRTIAEQLDFAFEIFDPIDSSSKLPSIPRLDDLPVILEKSNRLARIDRYLSTLEEFASFFLSVQQLLPPGVTPESQQAFQSRQNRECGSLEASRAREKIQHEQRLCQTYLKQFDTLVQLSLASDKFFSRGSRDPSDRVPVPNDPTTSSTLKTSRCGSCSPSTAVEWCARRLNDVHVPRGRLLADALHLRYTNRLHPDS
ncbi:MAG: hypothetical protein Q9218_003502 [Villophora microphyllina]